MRKCAPTLNECRPLIHDTLSMNSYTLFRLVYGPSVLSPKPLNPLIPMLGIPHAASGIADMCQFAAECVVEGVEPKAEFVNDRRREGARIADHRLMNAVDQLGAVEL